jgi:histidine triad (HIT) family protein
LQIFVITQYSALKVKNICRLNPSLAKTQPTVTMGTMEETIFTKIIKGEVPSYKIYEDEWAYAFLDIRPDRPGHTLVVSKLQVDKFYDLPDANYEGLMLVVKKLAKHLNDTLGVRILVKIIGYDVPHVHVHLIPANPDHKPGPEPALASQEDLAKMAERLKLDGLTQL